MHTSSNSISTPYLKKKDIIGIVSTARKITKSELSFGIKWLENLGFSVLLGKTIGLTHHQFAGTDIERAKDFQEMIDNPNIKAIWCARGGYGTVRIIDKLDFSSLQQQPKWIIGYSDITVLHSHLHTLNIPSLHAPMAFDIEKTTPEAQQSLAVSLKSKTNFYYFSNTEKTKTGSFSGIAIGGNLSVLYSLCGSESAIDTRGKILFLEDLDEYLYHVDRMLQNLDRNGLFSNLAGLVVGGMTAMHDHTIPFGYTVPSMLLDIGSKYNFPIVFNAPFGHIADNRAIVFGKKTELIVTNTSITLIN